jgi:molybdate transport system ATP-binding protein
MMLAAAIEKRLAGAFTLDVELSVAAGITMVVGASGAGKTTLLRCLAGLLRPDSGRVAVGGRTLFDAATGVDVPVQHRRIGYVFQHLALFPHLTVEGNLHYGLAHLDARARGVRTSAVAESFRIAHLLGRKPRDISGGERQRAALARSLVTDPALLLLDEPLSALDYATQSHIIADLREWNEARGIPILYVTHAHREVFALGERVVVLEAGRILTEGAPADVLDAPVHEPLALLAGFENLFDARVLSSSTEGGTMQVQPAGGGPSLEVPWSGAAAGADVRVAIRAGDIILATECPRAISARNVVAGTVCSVRREGPITQVGVDAGHVFAVHVTPLACTSLGLAAGRPVWLVIKTHSCHVVRPTPVP